jgi:hypothetical protein
MVTNQKLRLVESNMIQITCTTQEDNELGPVFRTIGVSEALACAISSRLRDLCASNTQRVFTADEVVGESIDDFGERVSYKNFMCS